MVVVRGVRVRGPLEGFAEGFAGYLDRLGYAPKSADAQLRLFAHVSVWLEERGLSAADLTVEAVGGFVVSRRSRSSNLHSERALVRLLDFLRGRGLAPDAAKASPTSPSDVLAVRFGEYLSTQRALAPATVASYCAQVRPFLTWCADRYGPRWELLSARGVDAYLTHRAEGQRPRSVQVGANALRALLRWMLLEGLIAAPLAGSVGTFAAATVAAPPRALTGRQVEDLVGGLSGDAAARTRDEAILALMWRTGLRAGEVACLRLEDLHWRAGLVTVRGKGGRVDQVPVPVDVGELITGYLRRARPPGSGHREVFLALDAPHGPLGAAAVSSVVARAATRAGLPGGCSAHRLRHTAACRVLAAGGGLVEAGELLRHAGAAATAVYARSDLVALSVLARPWPGTSR